MIEYEAGAIPSSPLTIALRDEFDNPVLTVGYDNWYIEMLDTDDRPVDMTGVSIQQIPWAIGGFSVTWPRTRSLFTKKGRYILRLVLTKSDGSKDITRTAEIKVREFGRLN